MRHAKRGRKLGREAQHRNLMLGTMAGQVITHGRIKTTAPKAKELRGVVDNLINTAKKDDLASRQLMDFLGLFTDGYQGAGAPDARQRGGRPVITDERPVEDLELTVRSYNCLKREGVDTIGQLATMTEEELMNIRNLGMKSVDEIRSKLLEYGYSLESEGNEAR
jgi:DNA-directed RNA polymerase alpha subunit